MKKYVPLLFLVGMAVATIFYLHAKDEPANGRLSVTQNSEPEKPSKSRDREVQAPENQAKPFPSVNDRNRSKPANDQPPLDSLSDFKKARSKAVVSQLGKDLNELLASEGFSQEEIDTAVRFVGGAFSNAGDSVKLSSAIDEASEALKLDSNRKESFTRSIFSAVNSSTSKFSYSEYQSCVNLRVSSASECVKEIAQDLAQKVAAKSEADMLNAQAIYALDPEVKAAIRKAIESCGESSENAEAYLKVNLSGCL